MGMIRKSVSLSTCGVIKFRSNRESNARSNRIVAKAAADTVKLTRVAECAHPNTKIALGRLVCLDCKSVTKL